MLKFVSKQEYWDVEDSGILKSIPSDMPWHLKSIQDAIVFSHVHEIKDQVIAEIGGGNSRILPFLRKYNSCYNIDEFQGVGSGPNREVVLDKVQNVKTMIGKFSELLNPNFFDIIFSISVVEHVPNKELPNFFQDCQRILKPGGKMIHLIDIYLEDSLEENTKFILPKLRRYESIFSEGLFVSPDPQSIITEKDLKFSAEFATNPDDIMNKWNKFSPKLRDKRSKSQNCSLIMVASKV